MQKSLLLKNATFLILTFLKQMLKFYLIYIITQLILIVKRIHKDYENII